MEPDRRERRIRRLVRITSLSLLLIACAYYVWPTPYRYGYERVLGNTVHVRTHRLTGKTYVATSVAGQGWRAAIMNPLVCRVTWTERAGRGPLPIQANPEAVWSE